MRRVTQLAELASQITPEPPTASPPRRFSTATFSSYLPTHPSQAEACGLVRTFAARSGEARRRWLWPWLRSLSGTSGGDSGGNSGGNRVANSGGEVVAGDGMRGGSASGLYLDGGYGVGKTHLLAAAFHASTSKDKAYLTFQQLVHLIGTMGMEAARERFASVSLLCLDEFELDDPGNTLIVKRFLEALFAAGGAVITTSNTPPEAQGRGRFNAQDFRREIQAIAGSFQVVSLGGSDYRRRARPAELLSPAELASQLSAAQNLQPLTTGEQNAPPATGARNRSLVTCDFPELLEVLRGLHPVRYGSLLDRIAIIFVRGVKNLPSQSDSLRFVHFIDHLYDRQVGLRASGTVSLPEIFDDSYRRGAYQKKYERCLSRLGELLEEPLQPALATPSSTASVEAFD
ncbi:MAG: cell division protein ZapE [Trueperaceae bacterium]